MHALIFSSSLSICWWAACSSLVFTDNLCWTSERDCSICSCRSLNAHTQTHSGWHIFKHKHDRQKCQSTAVGHKHTQTWAHCSRLCDVWPPLRSAPALLTEPSAPSQQQHDTPSAQQPECADQPSLSPATHTVMHHIMIYLDGFMPPKTNLTFRANSFKFITLPYPQRETDYFEGCMCFLYKLD